MKNRGNYQRPLSSFSILHSQFSLIGLFDSGVGGLSVWREVRRYLPDLPLTYLADQAHVPYGPRPPQQIIQFSEACVRQLIARGCRIIVVACNTATAAALPHLRLTFPHIPFVGMEPAVKPAAALTQTGVIGVLATHSTVKSERLANLIQRFAGQVHVIERACPDWVSLVEQGQLDQPHALASVSADLAPLFQARADTLVLGCTHFPFLSACIERAINDWRAQTPNAPPIRLIDPAPAVAQQCQRLWQTHMSTSDIDSNAAPVFELLTTGDAQALSRLALRLLAIPQAEQSQYRFSSVAL